MRGRELHGVQIFVNLSAENKLTPPQVLYLQPDQVPQWHSNAGDRARVVTGSFEGVSSPLVPVEPFTLLDARLLRQITFDLPAAHNAVVYVLSGSVTEGPFIMNQPSQVREAITRYRTGAMGQLAPLADR